LALGQQSSRRLCSISGGGLARTIGGGFSHMCLRRLQRGIERRRRLFTVYREDIYTTCGYYGSNIQGAVCDPPTCQTLNLSTRYGEQT
jgi:hypothetical protein